MSLYSEAERLMRMCVDDDGNPPSGPALELDSYLRLAQVCATLAVAGELRSLNSGRDQFYREVLEVLTQAKNPSGSYRSEQPAAATACRICGREASGGSCFDPGTTLTRTQWIAHHNDYYDESRDHGADKNGAVAYADKHTEDRFGPCPEES